jgi:PD-(D/E)XK nuclease superfamily protein
VPRKPVVKVPAKPEVDLQVPSGGPPPIVIRHSELADFRHCPLKHKLAWVEGWWSPAREANGKRELGSIWHEVLKVRYRAIKEGITDEDVLADLVADIIEETNPEQTELLWWMYDGYVEMYGLDSELEVISVEERLQVPFHDEDDKPLVIEVDGVRRPILYSWTTDLLARIREMRGLFVVDHKSTGQPLGQVDIDLSDQFGLYTVAWKRLGENVRGQLVNQAKTKRLKRPMTLSERFDRKYSIRTDTDLRAIELDAVDTIYAMLSPRNRRRPYSAPDPRSCSWKCDFKEPHLRLRRNTDPRKVDGILKSFGLEQGATHGQ